MKKVIIVSLLFATLFSGCLFNSKSSSYSFPNKGLVIKSVELIFNPNWSIGKLFNEDDFVIIRMLNADEIPSFMEMIYAFRTDMCITPPPTNYGSFIARVTYANGDVEMLGSYHIEFVKNGQEPAGVGRYYFSSQEAFEELFFAYADTAEYSEYRLISREPSETTSN